MKKAKTALLLICFSVLLSSGSAAFTIEEWLENANTPLIAVPEGTKGEKAEGVKGFPDRVLLTEETKDINQYVLYAIDFLSENKDKYPKLSELSGSILRVDDEARLFLTLALSEYNSEIVSRIKSLGGRIAYDMGERYKFIEAWIPYDKVISAVKIPGVRNISPTPMGFCQTGSVTSEGDTLHNADDLRNESSYDGSGTKVGVISDGCNNIASAQSTGDLPSIQVIDDIVAGWPSARDEGTAMMEIAYDLARGCALAFSEGLESPAEFINSVNDLVNAGCDVIVDDISWSNEPCFEDGSIADACNNAVDNGVFYCSSAGNAREDHYQAIADLTPGPVNIHGGSFSDVHAWDGGSDHTFGATAPSGSAYIIFQWSDKWGSSGNDYDIYVYNAATGNFITGSFDWQDGDDDPNEFVSFTGQSRDVDIVVHRYGGSGTQELELYFWGSWSNYEYNTPENSSYGHAVAGKVVGVAAQRYSQSSTEYFSSIGPATLYWPGGSSYTRDQPLITGCDGGKITGAGGFGSWDGSNWRFYGTSAAAPHIAGLAALALDMDNTLTPAEVKNMLINSATDIETDDYDYKSGWGKANVVSWCNSNNVTSTGTYDFEDVSLNFTQLSGSGTVYVECYPGVFPDHVISGNPIRRRFLITNSVGITSLTAEATLNYIQREFDDSDITDESSLYCSRWTGSVWQPYSSTVNTVDNTVTCTTSDFSEWGLGGTGGELLPPQAWPGDPTVNVPICTASNTQDDPTIVSDGSGGAIIAWEDYRSGNWDIYAQRVNASGTVQWTADGVPICTASGNQGVPKIVSDGSGGAIITWVDWRSGMWEGDIYAQRVNASGTVQWAANGVPICTAPHEQTSPTIVSDGSGGAIITWHDRRSSNWDWDIYAQRVNASGTVQWTANGVPICTDSNHQWRPTISEDGSGGAIITWSDDRSAGIYAQRVNASGTVQWTTNGVPICTAPRAQVSPTIVSDGSGGAIITWADRRSGTFPEYEYDIYAQRVNGSGTVQWTANGVPICTAPHYQVSPTIVSDGSGGAIITWGDRRSGNYDIYAQRVNGSGTVQWRANGVPICTDSNHQSPTISEDGSGGAIITWHDPRSGNNDIYAQRVSGSGTVQWTANGVPICTASDDQYYPIIVSDGSNGAIITWSDYRSGNYDIYAQRVFSDGSLPVTLSSFTAIASDGKVTVHWVTESEVDNLGFHVYRAVVEDGEYVRLTAEMLEGAGTSTSQRTYAFTDGRLTNGVTYWYKLEDVAFDGTRTMHGPVSVTPQAEETEEVQALPMEFGLSQNFPNPFNAVTVIRYQLPEASYVELALYDVLGQKVWVLVDGFVDASYRTMVWDARDVASGIYFVRMEAGDFLEVRKMVLIR